MRGARGPRGRLLGRKTAVDDGVSKQTRGADRERECVCEREKCVPPPRIMRTKAMKGKGMQHRRESPQHTRDLFLLPPPSPPPCERAHSSSSMAKKYPKGQVRANIRPDEGQRVAATKPSPCGALPREQKDSSSRERDPAEAERGQAALRLKTAGSKYRKWPPG